MFKTQGSKYELTAENIQRTIQTLPVSVDIEYPILIPKTKTNVAVVEPIQEPSHSTHSIIRKSTRYQTTGYEKYGNDESDEPDEDSGEVKIQKQKPIPGPSLLTSAIVDIGGKKRFPSSPASSSMNQLFWCAFIACKGESQFDMISNGFVKETEFKYETVEMLRGSKPLLKAAFKKYKLSLPNFEAELISSKRTTLQVAVGIALCYQKDILYIDGRLYIEICSRIDPDNECNEYTVIEKQKNRYCVYNDSGNAELTRCRSNLLKMESIESPIRSISFYKVSDLEDMCRRIELHSLPPKIKKAELYEEIMKYIQSSGIIVS
jgi:hypothetical protein